LPQPGFARIPSLTRLESVHPRAMNLPARPARHEMNECHRRQKGFGNTVEKVSSAGKTDPNTRAGSNAGRTKEPQRRAIEVKNAVFNAANDALHPGLLGACPAIGKQPRGHQRRQASVKTMPLAMIELTMVTENSRQKSVHQTAHKHQRNKQCSKRSVIVQNREDDL